MMVMLVYNTGTGTGCAIEYRWVYYPTTPPHFYVAR